MIQLLMLSAVLMTSPVTPLLEKLRDTAYMTGSFQQADHWALTLEEEFSSGTMHLAQPDLFKLAYSDPPGAATGYDGSALYTVEPDLQQVLLYPSREPESFLHLLDQCSDTTLSRVVESRDDSLLVALEGDFGEGINRIEVGFTLSDSLPFLFATTDYNGNTTEYRIWDISTAADHPEGVFSYSVPEGYRIITPGEM